MCVFTGSSNQLRILIGLERNCHQMRLIGRERNSPLLHKIANTAVAMYLYHSFPKGIMHMITM